MVCKSGRLNLVNAGFSTINRLDVEVSKGRFNTSSILVLTVSLPLSTPSRLSKLRADSCLR